MLLQLQELKQLEAEARAAEEELAARTAELGALQQLVDKHNTLKQQYVYRYRCSDYFTCGCTERGRAQGGGGGARAAGAARARGRQRARAAARGDRRAARAGLSAHMPFVFLLC